MRKNVLLVAGLCVLSTGAFASKARVEALGQSGYNGSYYINDARNMFRNAALVNSNKNFVVTEWGSAATTDQQSDPRPEGGFFREMGTFAYGLYLGNDNSTVKSVTKTTYLNQDNSLDFFFGGDMGMQWGARLHYANSKDETGSFTKKNSAFGLGLGVVQGDIEGYANVDLSDKSTGKTAAGDEWKLKPSFEIGGSYKISGITAFANYKNYKYEDSTEAAAIRTKKGNSIEVGAGRTHEVSPTARVITNASVVLATDENATAAGKVKSTTLPVTIGFETDATSWLTLRGSVSQNVILGETKNVSGRKSTNTNSTNANAGAALTFGKLVVDGVVGTTGSSRTATTASEQGVLATDNLMTRVGLTYNF